MSITPPTCSFLVLPSTCEDMFATSDSLALKEDSAADCEMLSSIAQALSYTAPALSPDSAKISSAEFCELPLKSLYDQNDFYCRFFKNNFKSIMIMKPSLCNDKFHNLYHICWLYLYKKSHVVRKKMEKCDGKIITHQKWIQSLFKRSNLIIVLNILIKIWQLKYF